MLYSVIASFPLFFAGGFAIRLQEDLGINKSQFGLAVAAYFITSISVLPKETELDFSDREPPTTYDTGGP